MHFRRQEKLLVQALSLASLFAVAVAEINFDDFDYKEDEVRWGLTNRNKTDTCIILNGIFQVLLPYDTDNPLMKGMTLLTVPRNASVSGTCGFLKQNMTLAWPPQSSGDDPGDDQKQHELTLTFLRKGVVAGDVNNSFSDPYYELDSIDGTFYAGEEEFPNFNRDKKQYTFLATKLGMLSAPQDLSYFCQSTQVIYSEVEDSSLVMSYVQAQAWHKGLSETGPGGVDFGPRSYCPKDGYQMIFTVIAYVAILMFIGVAVYFALGRRKKYGYVYL